MRCLIIDNYDSFTWNLADYVAQVFGEEPTVIYNDQYSWEEAKTLGNFGGIIVSPGPGSVTNDADFHSSRGALEQNEIPVLGVCLGFQGLAHVYGGQIERAQTPFHGRISVIHHNGAEMFKGVPPSFNAVRYHSLIVTPGSVPSHLRVTAQTECGLVMALEHKRYPKWGVQFHPESILTDYGTNLVANFYAKAMLDAHQRKGTHRSTFVPGAALNTRVEVPASRQRVRRKVYSRKLDTDATSVAVFSRLFASEPHCFWLDTQSSGDGSPRFSFMGAACGEDVLSHHFAPGSASAADGEHFVRCLEHALEEVQIVPDPGLPFEFCGGYVGFMSYEMKAAFGARRWRDNPIPDALWMRAERFVAFDHKKGTAWTVAIASEVDAAGAQAWMDTVARQLAGSVDAPPRPRSIGLERLSLVMNFGREEYLAAIARCQEKICAGESYEICLTNQFEATVDLDPFELYRFMRSENAAPFGAFIRSGSTCILSTSPERFLKVDGQGNVQAKPIKGTAARSTDPETDLTRARALAASEKDRAENLMIVDLMRNDLRRVSQPGTVAVPKLMEVESYKTVHQLVSTIESRLMPECTSMDLLRATFPGGSITGAPKKRTMEIIDQLEDAPRGVYCGSIGYLGYNRISDLNIAIRSVSYDGKKVRFGAGGAITYLSDPSREFDEVLLKAESVLRPLWHYVSQPERALDYRLKGNFIHL